MGDYDFNPSQIIHARDAFTHKPKKKELIIDKVISEIVGKDVYTSDQRVMKLVIKYKNMKDNPDTPDNFLDNPEFIKELKELFDV